MSRGPGRVQRAIMAYLREPAAQQWIAVDRLAHVLAHPDDRYGELRVTRAEVEATRRAALTLVEEGWAEKASMRWDTMITLPASSLSRAKPGWTMTCATQRRKLSFRAVPVGGAHHEPGFAIPVNLG